jgi:hypothetical protein
MKNAPKPVVEVSFIGYFTTTSGTRYYVNNEGRATLSRRLAKRFDEKRNAIDFLATQNLTGRNSLKILKVTTTVRVKAPSPHYTFKVLNDASIFVDGNHCASDYHAFKHRKELRIFIREAEAFLVGTS